MRRRPLRGLMLAVALSGLALWPDADVRAADIAPVSTDVFGDAFVDHIAMVRDAAERRDLDALIALSAPDIKMSFGGDEGPEGMRNILGGPYGAEAWAALVRVLDAGFAQGGGDSDGNELVIAPYWFPADVPETFDPFETFFVDGEDVLLRAAPSRAGQPIGAASHEFVRATGAPEGDYLPVTRANGQSGYLAREFLFAVVDYRAGFQRIDGAWKMVFFIAGD